MGRPISEVGSLDERAVPGTGGPQAPAGQEASAQMHGPLSPSGCPLSPSAGEKPPPFLTSGARFHIVPAEIRGFGWAR